MPLRYRQDPGDRLVIAEVLVNNIYLKEFLWPFLDQHGIVIDVGAHIGLFTVQAYRLLRPRMILAVEPEISNFTYLIQNIREEYGLEAVSRAFQVALWDRLGEKPLFLQDGNTGGASLIMEKSEKEGAKSTREELVSVKTLDSLLEEVCLSAEPIMLLKIDAEGSEVSILRGASKTLERTAVIVGEAHEGVANSEDLRVLLSSFLLVFGEAFLPLRIRTFWAVNKRFLESNAREIQRFLRDAPVSDREDLLWRLNETNKSFERQAATCLPAFDRVVPSSSSRPFAPFKKLRTMMSKLYKR